MKRKRRNNSGLLRLIAQIPNKPLRVLLTIIVVMVSVPAAVQYQAYASEGGNQTIEDFQQSKRLLLRDVYDYVPKKTIYCGFAFEKDKTIHLPKGFKTPSHHERAGRVEWEHVVPAENFGRFFKEWEEGDSSCKKNGHAYKGRKCATDASKGYRLMQADMYNLYPAVGAVNAMRLNYKFMDFNNPQLPNTFGVCEMKIRDHQAEPPRRARGEIARAMLYMDKVYGKFNLSSQQRQLAQAWNAMYPVTSEECERSARIEVLQKNENPFVKEACFAKSNLRADYEAAAKALKEKLNAGKKRR